MKIALINRDKSNFGGQEQHAQYLANELFRSFHISIITTFSSHRFQLLNKEIKVTELKKTASMFDEIFSVGVYSNNFRAAFSKQDYIIVNNPLTLFACQMFLLKKKHQIIISVFHSKGFSNNHLIHILNLFRNFIYLQIASIYSDAFVFLTQADKRYFLRSNIVVAPQKMTVIPNGINTKLFRPAKKKPAASSVIFVGRLTKSKGVLDILEVAESFPKITFTFVGEGPLKSRITEIRNCIALGTLNQNELSHVYRKHSIFLLPSYSESFPLSILEAMSSGLHIITTDIYGLKELVLFEGSKNQLILPGNTAELKRAIQEITQDVSLLKTSSKVNTKYAIQHFSVTTMGKKYTQLINDLAS